MIAGADVHFNGESLKSEVRSLGRLVQRIREEFEEAPGLRINVRDAARFWGLDETTCDMVLHQLVAVGFLTRGGDGRYQQA